MAVEQGRSHELVGSMVGAAGFHVLGSLRVIENFAVTLAAVALALAEVVLCDLRTGQRHTWSGHAAILRPQSLQD